MAKGKKRTKLPAMVSEKPIVIISTDASFDDELGLATVAYHIELKRDHQHSKIYQGVEFFENNKVSASTQAEFLAVIRAIKFIQRTIKESCNIQIMTDCLHVQHICREIEKIRAMNYRNSPTSKVPYHKEHIGLLRTYYALSKRHNIYSVKKIKRNSVESMAWCDHHANQLLNDLRISYAKNQQTY